MSRFKAFSDGQMWTIIQTKADGSPHGSALGSFANQKEADQRISEMLADEGVHLGVLNHKRSGFKLIHNGDLWVAWYSNAAMDLQGEYFPRKATDDFIGRVDSKALPPPQLWWYHLKGSKHGDALVLGRVGLLTLAVGKFDSTAIAEKFKSYYRDNQQELSHGFWYDPEQFSDGAYNYFNTFEITTLPPGNAANPYTAFEVMSMNPEKLKQLAEIVGEADAATIVQNSAAASKQLLELGTKFKAIAGTGSHMNESDDPEKDQNADDAKTPKGGKSIDARVTDVETTVTNGFKALTDQLAQVLSPIATVLQQQTKANTDLTAKVNGLEASVKTIAQFIRDEYAMQPPATQNGATLLPPSDPNLQFMNAVKQASQQNQPGQKGANSPLGVFGEIFGAMQQGGKSTEPLFEIPGLGNTFTPQPQAQVQPQQSPAAPGNLTLPQGMDMQQLVQSILPNQQPGVGIPRLGQ